MKDTRNNKLYLGFDVSSKTIEIYGRMADSEEGKSLQIKNTKATIKKFLEKLPDPGNTVIAMETGFDSPWMSDMISAYGCEVIVAHARELALIWGSAAKCDRRDAEMLARLACFDKKLLHPVKHADAESRNDLCVIKARDTLVRMKVTLINTIRDLLRSGGADVPGLTPENLTKEAPKILPVELQPALNGLLTQLCHIREEIKKYDRIVIRLCKKYPTTTKVRQIRGVGPITALSFVLVIGDPKRFSSAERLAAYLGLVPRRDQSGEVEKQLGITKQGNSFIRRYLIQGANYILGHFGKDCDLKTHGMKIAARGGKVRRIAFAAFLVFFSFSLRGNEEQKNRSPVIERRRIVRDHSPVTRDKNYFTFNSRFIGTTAQNVNRAIRHLPRITDNIRAFLKNDNNLKPGNEMLIPAWGGLYCNMPELTGRKDAVNTNEPAYVLSLLFCSKFEEAETAAKAILEKENENYGALLMLGLLSGYRKENFTYLDRAFLINPYKTLLVFDWHLGKFRVSPAEEWDFVDAFFQMLTKNKNLLRDLELPPEVAIRLNQAFLTKYEDKEVSSDMEVMISIIRKNMKIEKMREIHRQSIEKSSETYSH